MIDYLQLMDPVSDNLEQSSDTIRRRRLGKHLDAARPLSMASDEPGLDPQLAAMLEARKVKAGDVVGTLPRFIYKVKSSRLVKTRFCLIMMTVC